MLINFDGKNERLKGKLLSSERLLKLGEIQENFLITGDGDAGISALLQLILEDTLSEEAFVASFDKLDESLKVYKWISEEEDGYSQNQHVTEELLKLMVGLECKRDQENLKLIFKRKDESRSVIGACQNLKNYALMPVDIGNGRLLVLGLVNLKELEEAELNDYLEPVAIRIAMMAKFEGLEKSKSIEKNTENLLLDMVVRCSSDIISIFTLDMYPIYISPALKSIIGLEPEKLLNRDFFKEFTEGVKLLKKEEKGSSRKYQNQIERADGEYICLETVINPMHNSQGEVEAYVGISRDITAEVKLRERKEEALQMEKKLNSSRSEFISITSHEFKTPLSTIKSSIEICSIELKRKWEEIPGREKFQKHFMRVNNEVDRMNNLLVNLLNLEKINQGILQVRAKKKNINVYFETILENWLDQELISVVSKVSSTAQVHLDAELTSQVISNLVENALKYGSREVKPLVKLSLKNDKLLVCVQDFGEGIPKNDRKNIFKPFFRASNSNKYEKGSGLGLMIAKKFVELQNGNIYFESKEGKGTKFYIELPM